MTAFERWWQAWAERNERLYVEAQRAREMIIARRWADAHIRFHFGDNAVKKDADGNADGGGKHA